MAPVRHNAAVRSVSCPIAPLNKVRSAKVSLRQGAGTTDWTDLPDGQKPFVAAERTVEEWMDKFKDSRNSMRTMAAKMVAAMFNDDGKVHVMYFRISIFTCSWYGSFTVTAHHLHTFVRFKPVRRIWNIRKKITPP